MTKYFALVNALFVQQFRTKKVAKVNKVNGKVKKGIVGKIGMGILLTVAFLPICAIVVTMCYFAGSIHIGVDASYTLTLLMLAIQSFVLLFGLPSLIGGLFSPNDGDKLLYLPVSTATLFSAKLTIAYINELVTAVIGVLLVLLPFGIGASMGVGYYILLVPTALLLPALPLTIGCILSLPLSAITRRLTKVPLVKSIVAVLIFVAIMAVYMYGILSLTGFMDNLDITMGEMTPDEIDQYLNQLVVGFIDSIKGVMPYFATNYLMACGLVATTFVGIVLNTLGGYALCVVLASLAILLAITTYRKNMTAMQESGSGVNKKKNKNVQYSYTHRAVLPTMMLTTLKRFFRDGQISLQLILTMVMPALIVVVFGYSFSMGAEGDDIFVMTTLVQMIITVCIMGYLILLCSASNILAVYPFSLEKNKLYLLKIIPQPVETIMLGKVLLSTILITLEAVVCAIITVVIMGISWYSALLMCVAMGVYQFGTMCVTTYLDVKKPKLDWENYQSGLKNAKNSWISMLCGLLVILAIGSIATLFIIWYLSNPAILVELLMWITIIAVGLLYSYISYRHLVFHGKKSFDNLEL